MSHEVLVQEGNDLNTTVPFKWLVGTRLRLDASYYTRDVFKARKVMEEHPQQRIDQVVQRVFNLTRFKRVYARSDSGISYLSASEAMFFRPASERYLSKSKTENIDQYLVQKGWALLTCSGTVGRITYVGERLSKFAFTHDLIRIVPRDEQTRIGYLCAYLSSWIGQTLLTKDQYGSAVKHLEPHHINSIPVPLISEDMQRRIHEGFLHAYDLREKANLLLDDAQAKLYKELGLRPISSEEFLVSDPASFTIMAFELNLRLDASYHNPGIRTIATRMKAGNYPITRLGSKIAEVFMPNRFKRAYVTKEQGIPFLQGKHIVELKPYDVKYISTKVTKDIERCKIHTGQILVTRSGTIGRVAVVPKHWDGWTATEHLIRIVPDDSKAKAGYIAAFLMNPYGYYQIVGKTFGAVIGEISENHLKEIFLPNPPRDVQEKIDRLVMEAFELKEEANKIEQEAITLLEKELTQQA